MVRDLDQEDIDQIFREGLRDIRRKRREPSAVDSGMLKVPFTRSWEYAHSENLEDIIEKAVELGWADNKVQVKRYQHSSGEYTFVIEPYEEDCHCPSLLKYEDYVT